MMNPQNIHELFEQQAVMFPDKTAVADEETSLTYRELNECANKLAHFICKCCPQQETIVGILLDNSRYSIIAILGILKAGCTFLPLDAEFPDSKIRELLDESSCRLLISSRKFINTVNRLQWECKELLHILCIDSDDFYAELEPVSQKMSVDLWDYVGETADNDIAGGGWKSGYDGKHFSREIMDDYAGNALMKLAPYLHKQARVLEIGCSSGITMFKVAPFVKEYVGTDLSPRIIEYAGYEAAKRKSDNIELHALAAHELGTLKGRQFDIVIINSVVQNFSGLNYLITVLKDIVALMPEEGIIFLGDLLDTDLKEVMIRSFIDYKSAHPELPVKIEWDEELFISREFLNSLPYEIAGISSIVTSLKNRGIENELTAFRYDAIIEVNHKAAIVPGRKYRGQYDAKTLSAYSADNPQVKTGPGMLAYVLYTSGSTGRPKGVMVKHASVLNYHHWFVKECGVGPGDASLLLSRITFDGVYTSIWGTLLAGGSLRILRNEELLDAAGLLNYIQQDNITFIKITPTLLHMVLRQPHVLQLAEAADLRLFIIGGEPIRPGDVRRLFELKEDLRVLNHYGPTETTIGVIFHDITRDRLDDFVRRPVIGRPIANTRVYLLDEDMQEVAGNMPGEIYIAGDSLAEGYLKRPELTKQRFVQVPVSGDELLYRSGDLARWLPGGIIELIGRADDQVKIRGYRIEPGEIERELTSFPGVTAARVLAFEEEDGDKYLAGYYTGSGQVKEDEIKAWMDKRLPSYMIPLAFIRMDSFPMLSSGKINRAAFPIPRQAKKANAYEAPAGKLEEVLLECWKIILKSGHLGVTSNFFDAGGHSLKAANLVALVYKQLQVELKIRHVFEYPSVRKMATFISGLQPGRYMPVMPVDAAEWYDCSHGQRRLWILAQYEQSSLAYTETGVKVLKGSLSITRLQQAIGKVINRHEILRTTFSLMNGVLKQRVHPVINISDLLRYADIRSGESLDVLISNEERKIFDLENGPLIRILLLRTGTNEYVFILTMHHIISDGWSMNVLSHDIIRYYNEEDIMPLRIQYKDYAAWQQDLLKGEAAVNSRNYWLNRLKQPSPLSLPSDFKRPLIKGNAGAVVTLQLDADLCESIVAVAADAEVSLFMFLLTVVKVFLHRYTGQEDIIVGSSVSGREHADLQEQTGYYANILALRTRVKNEESFNLVLSHVKNTMLDAFSHHLYPFDMLVEELGLQRDLSRMPLFDVMVEYFHRELNSSSMRMMDGIIVETFQQEVTTAKYDLTFNFREQENGILLQLEYSTDLFTENTARRMIRHFVGLLQQVPGNRHQPVGAITYISGEEQQELLYKFNDAVYTEWLHETLVSRFKIQAYQTPLHIAVLHKGKQLTYRRLDEDSNRLGHYLRDKGIRNEKAVGVYMERGLEWMIAVLAIFKAGGTYVPLDTAAPPERIRLILEELGDPLVLTISPQEKVEGTDLAGEWETISGYPSSELSDPPLPAQLAYIIYTSGSTGRPKGAMIGHQGMLNHLSAKIRLLNISEGSRVAQTATSIFDISVWQMWSALLKGGTTIIYDNALIRTPDTLVREMCEDGISIWEVVPSYLSGIISGISAGLLADLSWLLVTGETTAPSLLSRWFGLYPHVKVVNAYGPTEASDDICHYIIDGPPAADQPVPVGKPVQNMRLLVLDQMNGLCPVGVCGEICVSGIGVGRGYWKDDVRTRESFSRDPFNNERSMYRTGDYGRWLPDGNLIFLGRADEQVKLRGYRIELNEIEQAINRHKDIEAAFVVLRGEHLAGYYKSSQSIKQSDLIQHLSQWLPAYMIPSYLIQVASFELTANGKVNRQLLPEPVADQQAGSPVTLPDNITARQLAVIYGTILNREDITITDDFFAAGGHSMAAIALVAEIEAQLGIKLTLKHVFENSRVDQLARVIEATCLMKAPLQVCREAESNIIPLSSIQRRFWIGAQTEEVSSSYNVCTCVRISGMPDMEVLKASFNALMDRHEILRTKFIWEEGDVMQRIYAPGEITADIEIVYTDSNLSMNVVNKEIARERNKVFNLEDDSPLFRVKLLHSAKHEYILIFAIHHIICDATSLYIIFEELTSLYKGQELQPLKYQFRDYAVWEKKATELSAFAIHREYWNQQFCDGIPLLQLSTDYPLSETQGFEGNELVFEIDQALVQPFRQLAADQRCTSFMLLFASLNMLLNKYTGQEDIVTGITISGRTHRDSGSQIGPYINTLPLRIKFHYYENFRSLLQQVRKTMLDAFEYQEYPMDLLMNDLEIKPEPGRTSFFDIMVSYRSVKEEHMYDDAGDLRFEVVEINNTKSQFFITIDFFESADRIWGVLNYNTSLFKEVSIVLMKERYLQVLTQIVHQPEILLSDIDPDIMLKERTVAEKIPFDY